MEHGNIRQAPTRKIIKSNSIEQYITITPNNWDLVCVCTRRHCQVILHSCRWWSWKDRPMPRSHPNPKSKEETASKSLRLFSVYFYFNIFYHTTCIYFPGLYNLEKNCKGGRGVYLDVSLNYLYLPLKVNSWWESGYQRQWDQRRFNKLPTVPPKKITFM